VVKTISCHDGPRTLCMASIAQEEKWLRNVNVFKRDVVIIYKNFGSRQAGC
jgi:hypothetical protein